MDQVLADAASFSTLTRLERYRLAKKRLRFAVYRAMETYVFISFVVFLISIWVEWPWLRTFVGLNNWIVGALGAAHYVRLLSSMPWLVMAAAFEGFIIWAAYRWGLSRWVVLPDVVTFSLFFAVARYWQRGERETTASAFSAYRAL